MVKGPSAFYGVLYVRHMLRLMPFKANVKGELRLEEECRTSQTLSFGDIDNLEKSCAKSAHGLQYKLTNQL